MEAINSLASAATKAIWGENNKDVAAKDSKEEPISGVQGDTSKGEPFDAGNMGETSEAIAKKTNNVPDQETGSSQPAPQPSSNLSGDSSHIQNDTRHPADANTSPDEAEAKTNVDNVEPLDPKSLKGPGPKPIAEVAKEHGGDAGQVGRDDAATDAGAGGPAANSDTPAAAPNGVKDEDKAEEHHDAYIKSSGVEADGGDFDASNAGAGREADRLLEQKGIHVEKSSDKNLSSPSGKDSSASGKSSSPERKGVKGLGHKLKAKLRRSSNA